MGLFSSLFGKPSQAQRSASARSVERCPVNEAPDDAEERERLDEESFLAAMHYMDDWAYDDYQQQLKEQEDLSIECGKRRKPVKDSFKMKMMDTGS